MMIQIDDRVVSSEILTQKFCCDTASCKGLCCVDGVSGAPLTRPEADKLVDLLPAIKPFLSIQGLRTIERYGAAVIDSDGDLVTPLVDGRECAFAIFERGITCCAIEKAWISKSIDFQKPISCHLYPIRVKEYTTFTALNYDVWKVCDPARLLGEKLELPVYRFLKDAIERAYGKEFYNQLEEASKLLSARQPDS
jgi:hypothetical protein